MAVGPRGRPAAAPDLALTARPTGPAALRTGPWQLCGSYDHANSLGYNLTDAKRVMYLERENGIRDWCRKGTAFRYEHTPGKAPPTLVQIAARALDACA